VNFSNLFKELKRRLRMRKRWLTLGAYLLLAGGITAALMADRDTGRPNPETEAVWSASIDVPEQSPEETEAAIQAIQGSKGKREVFVHKQYVCGEEVQQFGAMPSQEIMSLQKEHPAARVVLDRTGAVHLVENVEDLAPKCRENAYFGLDKSGNLTLFEGMPEQERVIRTFFQLDVQHMKSSLPVDAVNQLYSGIRVSDLADYNSVLSTFSEYAAEQAEPVANPQL
jgi:forespore regulator of the sigma-K checkpoint